jgi:predicted nucleic acid-binding protein
MNRYLLDTNVLLRASDPDSPSYGIAMGAVERLLDRGDECAITPQVLIEFWVVATRPVEVNGLGWDTKRTEEKIDRLLEQFVLLKDTEQVFSVWLRLVTIHQIKGKRTHDARLLAIMQVHGVGHLLTFNVDDFPKITAIAIVHPDRV